jgi:hypothetical protein
LGVISVIEKVEMTGMKPLIGYPNPKTHVFPVHKCKIWCRPKREKKFCAGTLTSEEGETWKLFERRCDALEARVIGYLEKKTTRNDIEISREFINTWRYLEKVFSRSMWDDRGNPVEE